MNRLFYGDNLAILSRRDANLIEQGWFEPPNAN
jgi:hypothetical protein